MVKTEKPPSFYIGAQVMPKDEKALWSSPGVSLFVLNHHPCKAPTFRGQEVIVLEVRWSGKLAFQASQFAKDYQRSTSPSSPSHFLGLNRAH